MWRAVYSIYLSINEVATKSSSALIKELFSDTDFRKDFLLLSYSIKQLLLLKIFYK
jgi:hypothetical protein